MKEEKQGQFPGIEFRKAGADDVEDFLALERSVVGAKTYPGIVEKDEALEEIATNECFILWKDGVPVGSIAYQMQGADHAYISGLVVRPQFQGQGIGRIAMEMILKKISEVERVDLVTHPQNTPAIMLYLSLGFAIESWKDNYWGDGEPRIVLVRSGKKGIAE